jgi:hypothetical protein
MAAGVSLHHIASQIVSVFETGVPQGDPTRASVLADGAGITYGLHQATDGSDSLDAILLEYDALGGTYARELRVWWPWLAEDGTRLENPLLLSSRCEQLLADLRRAGKDPVMRAAQEAVFARLYWEPAMAQCDALGLVEPLSRTAIYDLAIQSGLARLAQLRLAFPELPPYRGGDERAWTLSLLRARRAFLLRSTREVVRKSVYRVDALEQLAREGRWTLDAPFMVRSQTITAAD